MGHAGAIISAFGESASEKVEILSSAGVTVAENPSVIGETIAGGKTTRAHLARPVEVFLLYWTAYVTPDGQVNFRQDPYGWDTLLLQRIAARGGV